MNFFLKLILILIVLTLQSCTQEKKEISLIKENDQKMEMVSTYKEAKKLLNEGDALSAAAKFLEAELIFPQSNWASKSVLMASYAYYSQDYYPDAIFNLKRYLSTYPIDKRTSYAHFLLAICYYEGIANEKKDLEPLMKAKKEFNFIVQKYPNSEYAIDSKFKIDLINETLASKEMYVGRHYVKKKKWIPAIRRFKIIINEYDKTIYTEEAVHRLVEIHYHLGLVDEAKKYAALLGYNYGSGEWYKKTYKIFNKNYKNIKTSKKKAKKKGIKDKFKKIFE